MGYNSLPHSLFISTTLKQICSIGSFIPQLFFQLIDSLALTGRHSPLHNILTPAPTDPSAYFTTSVFLPAYILFTSFIPSNPSILHSFQLSYTLSLYYHPHPLRPLILHSPKQIIFNSSNIHQL